MPLTSTPVNKPSVRKSLCLFTNILDVKPKTAKLRIVAEESKHRATKVGTSHWTKKIKRKGHSKINEQIKINMYAWITRHPQVFQSPVSNDCIKVMFDDQTEPQLVTKVLLQVSVRELHNSLVSDTNDGGIKYSRDEYDNIITSDSTLRSLLLPQSKQISAQYKVMCGCECCISAKIVHPSLLSCHDRYLKNSNIKAKIIKA